MREYIKNERLEESEIRDEEIEDITTRLSNMQLAGELIRSINLNKYDGKILKYVAPYFNLNIDESNDSSDSEMEDEKLQKLKLNIKYFDGTENEKPRKINKKK